MLLILRETSQLESSESSGVTGAVVITNLLALEVLHALAMTTAPVPSVVDWGAGQAHIAASDVANVLASLDVGPGDTL